MAEPGYPLEGITVIDLGQIYNGAYATFLMAMAGAEVIKVEPPAGEPLRRRGADGGSALPFAMLNSNKRSVVANLKTERGRALLVALAEKADVVVENFTPGTLERLGVGWAVLSAANPRLIYASGSGYGRTGPNRDHLAMDLTVQAVSGVMSVTGMPDGPPLKAGPAICDFLAGIHLYGAVVTALYERERTGVGRLVEVAMQEATYPALTSNLGLWQRTGGDVPMRTGNQHGGLSIAPYNVYPAADGHVAIICVVEAHWTNLLAAIGRADLVDDPRFADNVARVAHRGQVDELIGGWTATLGKEKVFETMRRHHVPAAPVRDLVEVMNDPHMHGRGMLHWVDHPEAGRVVLPSSPLRYDGVEQIKPSPSAGLGQHNAEIYGDWLGLSADELARLAADGVI